MGKFITFEGIDGVGKSAQILLLEKYLQSKKIYTLITREPGGTEVGERMREILLHQVPAHLDSRTELLLMFAARAQHLKEIIYPALRRNQWVLCERFTDASYAYQGGGRGVPFSQIHKIETLVHEGFMPDLTILFTCKVQTGMQRIHRRGKKDRFEKEQFEFFERVQRTYLQLATNYPKRFKVVNAEQEISEVASEIEKIINDRFAEIPT